MLSVDVLAPNNDCGEILNVCSLFDALVDDRRCMISTYTCTLVANITRQRTKVADIISSVRKMKKFRVQGTSSASKATDGPRVSPLGDHMKRKDDNGDQPNGGAATWTNTAL